MLLQSFLESSASRLPDKVCLICGDERLTYREINDRAEQLAFFLRAAGIARQDRVAIFLENSTEAVVSLFGILKADAVFLILSPTLKAGKLAYILNDCQVKALITHTAKSAVASKALAQTDCVKQVIWVGPEGRVPAEILGEARFFTFKQSLDWQGAESREQRVEEQRAKSKEQEAGDGRWKMEDGSKDQILTPVPSTPYPLPHAPCSLPHDFTPHASRNIDLDLASIIYTSGSTGNPKGVMLTQLNMVSAATSITAYLENVESDTIFNCLPLSFDYGLYQVLMTFKFGGTLVLERSFTFTSPIIKKMVQEKVTGFPLVPTLLAILLGMKGLEKIDFSALRYISNTAAPLPPAHIAAFRKMFPEIRLYSMYGLTECKRVSYLPPEEIDRRPTSIGKGMPNEEVWVVDDQGNRVGPGVVGELVVRGSNVMRGYWGLPEETASVLRPGKYPGEVILYTGDLFKKDEEGYLYFVTRKDDLFKSRGERISPKEVENCLLSLPGVAEAVVIGVPDKILGQAIKAIIVCFNGYLLTNLSVLKHCKENLEDFLVPQYIQFVETLPRFPNGKIDKLSLKALEE
jgi:acyl-CoA synthetase (AMP-forming)/AMP-acid ligase II